MHNNGDISSLLPNLKLLQNLKSEFLVTSGFQNIVFLELHGLRLFLSARSVDEKKRVVLSAR